MAATLLRRSLLTGGPLLWAARSAYGQDGGYDPLFPGPLSRAADHHYDLVVEDAARGRTIPVAIAHQAMRRRMSVILFSHGLGGSRRNSRFLARHWLARGYVTVFLQHPGSDEAVWRGEAPGERLAALRSAATAGQLLHRMRDVVAVLDALAAWQARREHPPLNERMDLGRIGMAGHSFGALTTQAVAGQHVPAAFPGTWPDPRIKAALILSPSAPAAMPAAQAFAGVAIPWMLMTGTHDASPIGPPPDRLGVFPALPPGRKYELVLHEAEHSVFADNALPGERLARNPAHHRAILALSTAFWDSTLQSVPGAQAWLDGPGPATVLAPQDRWQAK